MTNEPHNQTPNTAMKTDTATPTSVDEPAKNKAQETTYAAKKRAETLAQEGKDQAATMAQDAKSSAHQRAEASKAHTVDETDKAADAFYDAADRMDDGSLQERVMGQIADGISGATDRLRSKDMSTAIDDLTRLARKHPVAFLGGAALLGFAVTRFAKATDDTYGRDHGGGLA